MRSTWTATRESPRISTKTQHRQKIKIKKLFFKSTNTNVGEDVEKRELWYTVGENVIW